MYSIEVFFTFLPLRFGAVFLWDSGSSVGELAGHSKSINSVDLKPSRPYRLISGSDDMTVAFSEGPPFKFKFTLKVLTHIFSAGNGVCQYKQTQQS